MILPPNDSKSELLVGYKIIKMEVKIMYEKTNMEKNLDKLTNSAAIDTDKFQQIILNIVENAHKYSNENTDIDVEIAQDDKSVIIRVSDVGAIIDEKDKDRIFEKFLGLAPADRKLSTLLFISQKYFITFFFFQKIFYPKKQISNIVIIRKSHGAFSARDYIESVFGNCTLLKRDKGYYIYQARK